MQQIHVSSNNRFLITADGKPFFWLADTAWELFHRCDRDEVEHYLEDRQSKGFNVIQAVVLAEEDGLNTPNSLGDRPLHDNDPERPNEAYFKHVDFVVETAASKGQYIAMLPTWGDKVTPYWGVGPLVFNVNNAYSYGRYLGERYRNAPNVIWVIGGDRPLYDAKHDYGPVFRAMAHGIQKGVDGYAFMTFHPAGGHGSSEVLHEDSWLSMNMWQSGHHGHDIANWEHITQDYQRAPTKPVLDGEPSYEDHPVNPYRREWKPEYGYFDAYDVRKQAYRAVFAGACGHTYGHHSIWQMYTEDRYAKTFPKCTWIEALARSGGGQVQHLRWLMESRPYLTRVPDQSLLASDAGKDGTHVRATRDANGSYALVYIPNARQTVMIDARKLSGDVLVGWWYDPQNGTSENIGEFESGGTLTFTTPDEGSDWVLVLDDKRAEFAEPGTRN